VVVDEDIGEDDESDVSYEFVASTFMISALEGFKMGNDKGLTCSECLLDDTIDAKTKVSLNWLERRPLCFVYY